MVTDRLIGVHLEAVIDMFYTDDSKVRVAATHAVRTVNPAKHRISYRYNTDKIPTLYRHGFFSVFSVLTRFSPAFWI